MSNDQLREEHLNSLRNWMDGKLDDVGKKVDKVNDTVAETREDVAVIRTEVGHHKEHIDKLEKKSDRWDRINSVMAILGGVIGAILRPGK